MLCEQRPRAIDFMQKNRGEDAARTKDLSSTGLEILKKTITKKARFQTEAGFVVLRTTRDLTTLN